MRTQHRSWASTDWRRRPPLALMIASGGLVLVVLTVCSVVGLVPLAATSSEHTVASPPATAAPQPAATRAEPVLRPARPVEAAREPRPLASAPDVNPAEARIEDRQACPPQFVACVNLRTHRAWLQRGATMVFGPTPLMPGTETALRPPGPDSSATPTGSFTVQYKNATQVSSEYGAPMPHAVFFAPGGIAFHEGSLTDPSHGCIHLSADAAATFFDQLQVGDPVLVF